MGRAPKVVDPGFEAVINAYDAIAEDQWKTLGHGRTYRQIHSDGWPDSLHYEFYNYADEVGIEFHVESDKGKKLSTILPSIAGQELVPGLPVQWDPRWSRHRGRLLAKVSKDQNPATAAQAMKTLISKTMGLIEANILK